MELLISTNHLEDRARTQPDEEMDFLQPMRGGTNGTTCRAQSRLQESRKVKSSILGGEFKTRDEVIDLAVEQLYDQLKAGLM